MEKKYYVKPELQANEVEAETLICLSIGDGKAEGDKPVLAPDAPKGEEAEYGNLW